MCAIVRLDRLVIQPDFDAPGRDFPAERRPEAAVRRGAPSPRRGARARALFAKGTSARARRSSRGTARRKRESRVRFRVPRAAARSRRNAATRSFTSPPPRRDSAPSERVASARRSSRPSRKRKNRRRESRRDASGNDSNGSNGSGASRRATRARAATHRLGKFVRETWRLPRRGVAAYAASRDSGDATSRGHDRGTVRRASAGTGVDAAAVGDRRVRSGCGVSRVSGNTARAYAPRTFASPRTEKFAASSVSRVSSVSSSGGGPTAAPPAVRSLRLHIARAKASSSASSNEVSPVPSTVPRVHGVRRERRVREQPRRVSGSRAERRRISIVPRPDVRTPVAFGSHPATDAPRRSPARRRRRCLRRARQPPRSPPPRARTPARLSPRTRSSRRMRTRRPRDDDRPRTPRLRRPSPTRSRTARHPEPSLRRFEVWHHTRVSTWMSTSTRPRCSGSPGANPLGRPRAPDYCALGFPTIISHCFAGDGNAHESGRSFGAREHTDGGRRAIRVRAGVFQARANVPFLLFSLPFRVRPTRCAFCVTARARVERARFIYRRNASPKQAATVAREQMPSG